LGGWSEQLVVPAKDVLVLPETIELAPACTLEVTYGTAWGSLELGRGIVGDEAVVAVRGVPGGVALAVAQLCHLWEVPVAGIVRDLDSSRVLATKARLPWLPLVSEQQAREGALKDVLGARPNMVVDPLGGDYIAHDIDLVDRGGAVAVIGAHLGAESSVRWDKVFSKAVAIYGVARAPSAVMQRVVESVADGSVKPLVDKIFAFSDIDRAVAYAENPDGIGRVLLRMESVEDRDAGG
jgi:NADPH:quinone reductase-like Zn-dependent oxidoreductase